MDKLDQIYRQLNNPKRMIEYLRKKFRGEDSSSRPVSIAATPVPVPGNSNTASTNGPLPPQPHPHPTVPRGGMSRLIQQIGDELTKPMQNSLAASKELHLQRSTSFFFVFVHQGEKDSRQIFVLISAVAILRLFVGDCIS
jgi:hypothetical protein